MLTVLFAEDFCIYCYIFSTVYRGFLLTVHIYIYLLYYLQGIHLPCIFALYVQKDSLHWFDHLKYLFYCYTVYPVYITRRMHTYTECILVVLSGCFNKTNRHGWLVRRFRILSPDGGKFVKSISEICDLNTFLVFKDTISKTLSSVFLDVCLLGMEFWKKIVRLT
jgi:hypothetical protein